MKTGILATGITPDELLADYGSYADMFISLFGAAGQQFEFEVFDVRDGVFPDSSVQCDGWIITGSRHGVYENLPWMLRLQELIVEIRDSGRPMVGICFGHQIIAQALGGKVEKSDKGWGIGLQQYELQGEYDFIPSSMESFAINAMHQDQVVEKPADAERVAYSDFCPNAGLLYHNQILTFQAHPEFSSDYERDLIRLRAGGPIPLDVAEQGLATLAEPAPPVDSLAVAGWMAEFLKVRAVKG